MRRIISQKIYSRIFLNRATTAFFIFSIILCLSQSVIQSFLFTIDSEYNDIVHNTISAVNSPALRNITEIRSQFHVDVIQLSLCNAVPIGEGKRQKHCIVMFDTSSPRPSPSPPTIVMNEINISPSQGTVTVLGKDNLIANVTPQCAQSLLYVYQNLHNFRSEDITFIVLQFWLLGISVFAIASNSVAHLWTVLIMRSLVTAWSSYSLWRTQNFKTIFGKLYADPGTPCGIDFFSSVYFPRRQAYEMSDLVLNMVGFLITTWFSWQLLRTYNTQAVRYFGAPQHINRINKLLLAVLSCLQLEVFILVTAMGLWIDILVATAIKDISSHTDAYLGAFITTMIVLIPWISMGWYGIRREMKKTILLFFFLAVGIIVGWFIMFYSMVYRWALIQWPFLAGCSITSFILIISSTALAIICRLNFGRGLKQYFRAEAELAKSGFVPEIFCHDEEKNTPLDLGTIDTKHPVLNPTSPSTKEEILQVPSPTYLARPSQHNQPGFTQTYAMMEGRTIAQGAPLPASRLAERATTISVRPLSRYTVKPGEAF